MESVLAVLAPLLQLVHRALEAGTQRVEPCTEPPSPPRHAPHQLPHRLQPPAPAPAPAPGVRAVLQVAEVPLDPRRETPHQRGLLWQ